MSQAGIPTLEIPICYNVFPCSPGLYHDGEQWSMVRKMIRYLLRHEQDKEVIRTALDHLALFLTPSDKSSVPQYAAEMVQRILKETNTATDHEWYTKFTNLRENSEAKILEPYLEQLNEELWLRFSRIPLRDWIRLTLTNIQSSSVYALIDGLEHIRNSLSRSTESYLLNVRSRKPNFLMNACLSKEYTWQDALSPLRRGIEETVCHVEIAKGTSERPRTPAVDFSMQLRVFLSRLEILKLQLHRLRASRNTSSWRRLNDVYWLPFPHPAAMFGILDLQQHHKKTYLIRNDLVKLAVAEEIVRNLSQRVIEIMTVEPDTVKCLENLLETIDREESVPGLPAIFAERERADKTFPTSYQASSEPAPRTDEMFCNSNKIACTELEQLLSVAISRALSQESEGEVVTPVAALKVLEC